MNLTKSTVDRLGPPEKGYSLHWDDSLPGFGVRVTSSGAKSFVFQRRVAGKQRRITVGRLGHLTVQEARQRAHRLAVRMADGIDPVRERKRAQRGGITLDTAFENYRAVRHLKLSTIADQRRSFRWAFADWLELPLREISREMVSARHRELGKKSMARANLAMRYLRAVFNFARAEYRDGDEPLFGENPVRKLSDTRSWFRVDRRRTVIKAHEVASWYAAVEKLPNRCARDFLLVVLFTGLRHSEAINLQWADIDFVGRALTIPDTKSHRPHTLPIPDFLFDILQERRKSAREKFVFSYERGRLQNLRSVLKSVEAESGVRFCVHDLRRTFATVANSVGIPAYAVKALLNHKSNDVTAGYIVTDVEGLREPMKKIAAHLLSLARVHL